MKLKLWNRKKKDNEPKGSKDIASMLKGSACYLTQPRNSESLTDVELKVLNHLISYLDTFLLKCFENGKLKHYTWITTRLLEASIILRVSNDDRIKALVRMIEILLEIIVVERSENGDEKENK